MANNHNNFDNNGDHLVLSHDLLKLLQWFIDHESDTLKQMIVHAIEQGFTRDSYNNEHDDALDLHVADESLQQNVIIFLETLDTLLSEAKNETAATRLINRNRMPVLDHIDLGNCEDNQVLQVTIDRVNQKLEHNPAQNRQELLLQELLKRWKPDKNQLSN